jgi:signal transduction protein with GAF and PtsI domain
VSDVSGVVGGGLVESIAAKFGLPEAGLSRLQKNLRITRFVATAGAAVGVILGCCLGMTTLLFIDPSKKEREKKSRELSSIFSTIMDHSHNLIGADMCSLLFVDREKQELWSRVATGTDGKMLTSKLFSIPLDKGIAGEVVRTGKVISVSDAYRDKRFYQGIDDKLQMRTRSILAVPVKDEAGEVVAVIEMMNKRGGEAFSADDERIVTMLAHHVRVFVQCMEDTP